MLSGAITASTPRALRLATTAGLLVVGGLGVALVSGCTSRGAGRAEPSSPPEPPDGSGGDAPPTPIPPTAGDPTLRIAQLNAQNLFDTVDAPRVQDSVLSPAEYQLKLTKLALAIRDQLGSPDALALEEVENEQVLRDLAAQPEISALGYQPVLLPGSDPRGIDVAVLYRPDRFQLVSAHQLQSTTTSATGRRIPLFTRPPLAVTLRPTGSAGVNDAATGARDLTLLVNHFTSKLQGADGDARRLAQARWVASVADGTAGVANLRPDRTIVLGDLNAAPGEPPMNALLERGTLVELADRIEPASRYSYGATASRRQLLDHVLMPPALAQAVTAVRIPHDNTGAPSAARADATTGAGASDHDPILVELAS